MVSCFFSMLLLSCNTNKIDEEINEIQIEEEEEIFSIAQDSQAVAIDINVSGEANNYTFAVTLQSPDRGCDQYADWWEVLSLDGQLLYRRILGHSHINEQPFTRSGGPVPISENDTVLIRGHMNNFGYGSLILKGSVSSDFTKDTISDTFAKELMERDPLPENCAF